MKKLRRAMLCGLSFLIAIAACVLRPASAPSAVELSLRERRSVLSGQTRILELRRGASLASEATASPGQSDFAPVPTDHWAYPALQHLSERGLLNGYPDGFFKGDRPLTRGEFAEAMSRMLPVDAADSQSQLAALALRTEFSGEINSLALRLDELSLQLQELQARLGQVNEANDAATP
ncbi:MAG: S-layer homology domain-containing protein [bacterium]